VVLGLLFWDAEPARVWAAISGANWHWVLIAVLLKGLGLTTRELRLWISLLPWKRVRLPTVMGIGYCSGLINNLLPARGGDLLAVGLIASECPVSGTAALAAVGATSVLEALVFAAWMLGLFGLHAGAAGDILGAAEATQAMGRLSLLTLLAVAGAVGLVILSRVLRKPDVPAPAKPGLGTWLRQALVDAGTGLGAAKPVAMSLGLALLQVACFVGCLRAVFVAIGLEISMPWLAASLVLGLGSFAALVLPQGLPAGVAVSSALVLTWFGATEAQALAFGTLAWVAHLTPIALLGAFPLWSRLGRIQEVRDRFAASWSREASP